MATACGALLIFDEVMTGFRLAMEGAGTLSSPRSDLLGKVIGGGLPSELTADEGFDGADGSTARLSAGTLSGNRSPWRGIKTLKLLREPRPFKRSITDPLFGG